MPGYGGQEWLSKPTLNKEAGGASLTFLPPIVSKIKKKIERSFLKTHKIF